MNILLIEPAYKAKYPPLGLMKISAFHKKRGDNVTFFKGLSKSLQNQFWDRIYISSLFSFYWSETIKAIKYYEFSVKDPQNLFIGGPLATLMGDEIQKETGFNPVRGLLNVRGKLRIKDDHKIDDIVPDYSMLENAEHTYSTENAYFSYTTRGCIRRCKFCAVPNIEPFYVDYIPLRKQIKEINELYGVKKDLILLDNNILASPQFDRIIDEIKSIGYQKGARLNNSYRWVDFNQGIDLRLLTKEKMKRLSEISIYPMRIAFDHISLKKQYIQRIEWASDYGIKRLSNYVLYNYKDTPEDFYERLRINVELNERLGTNIYSFPMKYIPVNAKDRAYVGDNWTPRFLRSIQCILQATHGVVGTKKDFFEAAFGKNLAEYKKLLIMPSKYIIYREKFKNNGASEWEGQLDALSAAQKKVFIRITYDKKLDEKVISQYTAVNSILEHYKNERKGTDDSFDDVEI
jgi:hypothetical protein